MKLKVRRLPDRYTDDTIGIDLELDPEMLRRLKVELSGQTFDSDNLKYSRILGLIEDIIFYASKPKGD
jgi:hypothetical protein